MSLRNVVVPDPAANTTLEMVRVAVTDEGIFAVWKIRGRQGVDEKRVEVGQPLAGNILGRVAFNNMLDQIAADTQGRVL
jgi:hypothetical protein